MPVTFFSVLGLFLLSKRQPRLVMPLLAVLLLELYVNASTRDWFGGGGFGPRRYISELPIFIIGYAGFLQAFSGRIKAIVGGALGLVLSIQQWILLRYALVERIGGRNLSMAPDFLWEDVGYRTFLQQLAAHVPDAVHHPLDFFILPGTLFDGLMAPRVIHYVLALLATVVFVVLYLKAGKLIAENMTFRPTVGWGLTAIVMVLIVAINLWILVWA
jgi:hypothetical protein